MAIWIKPNGNKLETNDNDATTDYMVSIGCKLEGAEKPKPAKPKLVKKTAKKAK